ncbi:MAG: hypothetical protein AAF821_11420 [Cyanobacteria bacterium P01_D01_bin.156]
MAANYPQQVIFFHQAFCRFRGVVEVNTGIKKLDKISLQEYHQSGPLGDLPHALLRRTEGGLAHEAWANTDVILSYDRSGWLTLEFLSWWVREQSRRGEQIQMRPQALAPTAGEEIQLGQTLKFVIDHFCILSDDTPQSMLSLLEERGQALNGVIDFYSDVLNDLLVKND